MQATLRLSCTLSRVSRRRPTCTLRHSVCWLYMSAQFATAVRSASQVRSTAQGPTFSSGKRPRISSQKEGCLDGLTYVELTAAAALRCVWRLAERLQSW